MIAKIVTIVQARTGSTRLPNKIMLSAAGKPLLIHLLERVRRSKYSGQIIVATTESQEDDIIENVCVNRGYDVFRGHTTDLLDRHYHAAAFHDADIVLKIPSDCPLIDPNIIDEVIEYFLNGTNYDYVSNLRPPTFPDGNDVEIFSFDLLKYIWENAEKDYEREHTTPYIWNNPEKFRIGNVYWKTGLDYSNSHRWTLDFEEDYTFIRQIYEELYDNKPDFGIYDILNLLETKPYLMKINKMHTGKYWYTKQKFDFSNEYGN
jgi:spore coat polysaccharide biosynthesis protein SpsF